jgi:hypothetical protein
MNCVAKDLLQQYNLYNSTGAFSWKERKLRIPIDKFGLHHQQDKAYNYHLLEIKNYVEITRSCMSKQD